MIQGMEIRYDPKLVEEAVFHFQRDSYIGRELDERRGLIYEVCEAEERERLFRDLYGSWFARLGLAKPIEEALREQTTIAGLVGSCYIVCATHAKQEGAELFVASNRALAETARRTLRILIRPESLLKPEFAVTFLRHELYHIADMLDPAFAYEPTLPQTDGGPTYDTLIMNRYRVLWDVTINARMMRRGWLPDSVRDHELTSFRQAFPMLGESGEEYFEGFFDGRQPTHSDLAAFALDPRAAAGRLQGRSAVGTHCPLCKFPSHSFEPKPENLDVEVLSAISRDFPNWTPALGLCAQCADLYRASELSIVAARALPGWKPWPDKRQTAH
jgi:hypothetical protein